MTSIIIVLAAFFIMYLIVFLGQIKRKKENQFSSVEEFHIETIPPIPQVKVNTPINI